MILKKLNEEDIKQIARNRPIKFITCPAMNNLIVEDIFCFNIRKCPHYQPISEDKFECNYKKQTEKDPNKSKLLKNLSNQSKENKISHQIIKENLKSELKQLFEKSPQKFKVKEKN